MSLEDAINNHALALKDLAAAIRDTIGTVSALSISCAAPSAITPARQAINEALEKARSSTKAGKTKPEPDMAAVEKENERVAEAEAEAQRDNLAEMDRINAEAAQAAADAAAASAGDPGTGTDAGGADQAELDYAKDVRPVLLAAIKKGKRAEIEAHLAKAGVKKADELPAENLPALLDLAQKLAA